MALFKISKGNSADLGVRNGTDKTVEGYAYFTPDDGKFYIDIASSNTVELGINRIVLNSLKTDIQQSFTVSLNEQSSFWTVDIPGLTQLIDGLIIHISVPIRPNNNYNVLNINGLGNKMVYYKFNEPLGDNIDIPAELTLIYHTTVASFDQIFIEHNEEVNYGRSGWIVDSAYSINKADIYYGNLAGNAATATKLLYTPNNKMQFLRGDNIWTNKLFGDIYADNFCGSLIGNADTATEFYDEQIIKLLGDVSGEISSTAGWTIPTTVNYLTGTNNNDIRTLAEGKIQYLYNAQQNYMFPISDDQENNYNGILTFNLGEGNYYSQLGLSSNNLLYYRHLNDRTLNNNSQWSTVLTMNLNNYTDSTTSYVLMSNGANIQPSWTNTLGTSIKYFNNSYITNMYSSKIYLRNIIGYEQDEFGNYLLDEQAHEIPIYGIATIQTNYPLIEEMSENQNYTYNFPTCNGTFVIGNNTYTDGYILRAQGPGLPAIWSNSLGNSDHYLNAAYFTSIYGQNVIRITNTNYTFEPEEGQEEDYIPTHPLITLSTVECQNNITCKIPNINYNGYFVLSSNLGTAGQILRFNNSYANPRWETVTFNGSTTNTLNFYAPTNVGTANYILKSSGLDENELPMAPIWVQAGIKLNGAENYAFTASFYAPTSAGTANYILKANGLDEEEHPLAPTWTAAGIKLNGAENYALTASFYAPVSSGSEGQILLSNGSGQAPTWTSTSNLTTTGTITTGTWHGSPIGVAYGGTGKTSWTQYGIIYASASDTLSQVSNNTSDTRKFLRMTGTGSVGATPAWDTVTKTDVGLSNVENTKLSTWAGTSNITTIGTITTGTWHGSTMGVAYGGTGTTEFTANSIIMSGSGTTSALTTRAVTNNTSNTTITNGTNIPTMNTLYYGLAQINNATQSRATSIYAPTSGGTAGYILKAGGSTSTPSWSNDLGEITFQKLTTSSANDNYGLFTASDNYGSIGSSSKCWYNLYIARIMFRGGTDYTLSYSNSKLTYSGDFSANKVYNAVWNDYAEYRQTETIKYGHVYQENNNGIMTETNERLIPGCSIASDTFGSAMGETDIAKTPMAVAGRVLVYTYQPRENYQAGMAVCSAPNGTIDIMTREEIMMYPDCIIGYVSEIPNYKEWGKEHIKVDNRIWIKI